MNGNSLGAGFANQLEDVAVDMFGIFPSAPVVRHRFQLIKDPVLPALLFERTRTGIGVLHPLLAHIAVFLMGHHFLGVHDIPPGQHRLEGSIRLGEGKLDGVVIDHLNPRRLQHVQQHPGGAFFDFQGPFKGKFYRLGRQRVTVMKFGVFDQVKGPHLGIRTCFPFGRQPGDDLGRAVHIFQ